MNIKLQNDIIEWLESSSEYWMKLAGHEILQGNSNMNDLAEKCFPFFENDNILNIKPEKREEIKFKKVADSNQNNALRKIKLKKIHNIQNVNALTSNQIIEINDSLTVIYGNNGSGKSSYTRLLNNAFNSRGDKALVQNVYTDKKGEKISCEFIFNDGNSDIPRNYPSSNNCVEFSQFAVFDNKSSKTHLDSENNLLFVPSGFDFFNMKIEFVTALKRKVDSQINSLTKPNPFLLHFRNDNLIYKKIKELNANTKFSELKQLADFKDSDEKKMTDLLIQKSKLNPQYITKQIGDLEKLSKEISLLKECIATANKLFSETSLKSILDLFLDYKLCLQLVEEEGFEGLKDYKINHLQSKEWKEFIQAAFAYVEILNTPNSEEHNHQNQLESCPFCLQVLGEKEKILIGKYWILLRSQATLYLEKLKIGLNEQFKQIQTFDVYPFNQNNILYQFLQNENNEDCKSISNILNKVINFKSKCIEFFNSKEVHNLPESSIFANDIIIGWGDAIALKINLLVGLNIVSEISILDKEIELLSDKKKLSSYLAEIENYLKDLQWIDKAVLSKSKLNPIGITKKQGELYSKYITEKYSKLFEEECITLDAPKTVEILQRHTKGQTVRSLKIKDYVPSDILSEGEQRSIALADFLTEIQLDENNMGVIFDDPVTSLDHIRRSTIAQRISELAKTKQVIVFTHDLVFVDFLKSNSDKENMSGHWITNQGGKVGSISLNNGPVTESGYKNTDIPDKLLKECEGLDLQLEQQERILKEGFGALRSCYEYLIIYDLFQGVILRFEERTRPDKLSKVVVTPEITQKIISKIGDLSRHIEGHLHSNQFIHVKPTIEILSSEIKYFRDLKNELKALRIPIEAK
jgi:energy-coupling factor transporter ATP-binding protein EcfA2